MYLFVCLYQHHVSAIRPILKMHGQANLLRIGYGLCRIDYDGQILEILKKKNAKCRISVVILHDLLLILSSFTLIGNQKLSICSLRLRGYTRETILKQRWIN